MLALVTNGARETEVMFRHAESLCGCHENAGATTDFKGNGLGGEGIGADGSGGPVLFGGSKRDDHALAVLEVGLNFRPAAQGESDAFGVVGGAWIGSGHRWLGSGLMIAQLGLDQWAVPFPSYLSVL